MSDSGETETGEVKKDPERIYLDYNATTPVASEVQEAVLSAMKEAWGNPSSSHAAGVKARRLIDEARANIAFMLGAKSSDIVFTSGGTESNNWVLQIGLCYFRQQRAQGETNGLGDGSASALPHFITSNVEHDSVKLVLEHFQKEGLAEVSYVPVSTRSGRVEVDDVIAALRPTTVMISIMLANNETGVLQPVAKICELVQRINRSSPHRRVLLHTDAAQALGKVPVDVSDLGVDFLTIVGHKFYGPRIGALYVREPCRETAVFPQLFGGGQERNLRPGTENTPMIAGLGRAAELVHLHVNTYQKHMAEVRDYMEEKLRKEFGNAVCFNARFTTSERLPNTCNVSFTKKGLAGHKVLAAARRLQASIGAACHAQNRPSPILLASGVSERLATNALRLSVGRETSIEDIDIVISDLRQAVKSLESGKTSY